MYEKATFGAGFGGMRQNWDTGLVEKFLSNASAKSLREGAASLSDMLKELKPSKLETILAYCPIPIVAARHAKKLATYDAFNSCIKKRLCSISGRDVQDAEFKIRTTAYLIAGVLAYLAYLVLK